MDNLTLKPQYNDPLSSVAVSMQSIARALNRTDQAISWDAVSENVSAGFGPKLYSIGDEFEETWTDTVNNISYKTLLHVNHFDEYADDTGKKFNGMVLQSKYVFGYEYGLNGMSFSSERAFLRCPDGLDAGTYNITFDADPEEIDSDIAGKTYSFTLTKPVPKGGSLFGLCYGNYYSISTYLSVDSWWFVSLEADGMTEIEHQSTSAFTLGANGTSLGIMKAYERNGNLNSIMEIMHGCNRWRFSKLRQYLNSDVPAGQGWWTKQDDWDVCLSDFIVWTDTKDIAKFDDITHKLPGFLYGFPDDLKNKLKTIKNETTAWDPETNSYTTDVTFDKIFIPSATEMCVVSTTDVEYPEFFEDKGVYHEYWQEIYGRKVVKNSNLGTGNYNVMLPALVDHSHYNTPMMLRSAFRLSYRKVSYVTEMNRYGVDPYIPLFLDGFLPTMVIG